jgi:hypothetical protein
MELDSLVGDLPSIAAFAESLARHAVEQASDLTTTMWEMGSRRQPGSCLRGAFNCPAWG